jgi:PKD repeat protein
VKTRRVAVLSALVASAGCTSSNIFGPQPSSAITASCAALPSSGFAPLPVIFSLRVEGAPEGYTAVIQYGDGTSGTNFNVAHLYPQPGVYGASIQVQAVGGQMATCGQSVTVSSAPVIPPPESIPRVVFKVTPSPPTGPAPLTVHFNMCNASDSDGDPFSYTYAFGDGSSASGFCRESHTYVAPHQTFTAVVCIQDPAHRDCKQYVVTTE